MTEAVVGFSRRWFAGERVVAGHKGLVAHGRPGMPSWSSAVPGSAIAMLMWGLTVPGSGVFPLRDRVEYSRQPRGEKRDEGFSSMSGVISEDEAGQAALELGDHAAGQKTAKRRCLLEG